MFDASVVACWAFDDEDHRVATSALERIRTDEARVPALWWFEIRNTLIVNERRKRLTENDTAAFLRNLSYLRLTIDHEPDEARVLALARRHRLSVYNAAYLECAIRKALPIATLDTALAVAARTEGIPLIGERDL